MIKLKEKIKIVLVLEDKIGSKKVLQVKFKKKKQIRSVMVQI